jgi:c-di-GMP-binding flagellar brake protein YcgR
MDTRIAPRINITFKVITKVAEEAKQKFKLAAGKEFEIQAVDINKGGIGFNSKFFLPQGLIIELDIEGKPFGLGENMKLKGEVRYCKFSRASGYKCGVKFMDLPENYQKAVADFISAYEKREHPRLKLSD